jgi:cyanate permease
MGTAVFTLCALTSLLCAGLLWRAYRAAPAPLLLGALLCFVGLAINNLLLFVDAVFVHGQSFEWRGIPTLLGLSALLWTIVQERA